MICYPRFLPRVNLFLNVVRNKMDAKSDALRGKRVLAIGDSITSDGRWQAEFERITGSTVTTHARGGVGIIDMVFGLGAYDSGDMRYDPYTGANRELPPLTEDDVADCDLLIFFGGYNERHAEYGSDDDIYPENDTLNGKFNAVMGRIISLLESSGNCKCRVMMVSPHCVGKYDWVDADGTEEFPAGSGRTLETMSSLIRSVARRFGAIFYDAYSLSGIGPDNWCVFANSSAVYRADYDPGKTYEAPYPQYADQAHLNAEGYKLLGEKIAHFALSI